MYKIIKLLFCLLTKRQRRQFYLLQIMVVIMAFTEIIGVASIIPFMALVGDMNLLQQNNIISNVYKISGITSESNFVLALGTGVLLILLFSAMFSMFTTWRLALYANKVGVEIADRLYEYYLNKEWLFHALGSSAEFTKKISYETARVTNGLLLPLLQMNARVVLAFFMSLTLFIYNTEVALVGLSIFIFAYYFLYKIVRIRLHSNGKIISDVNEDRFRLMNEGFGGIKDILLLGRGKSLINKFGQTGNKLAYSQGANEGLAHVPRFLMELAAYGCMISLVLYLVATHDSNIGIILPILSVYALAGFKLLPAFQQIYVCTARIRGNIAAFESIQEDLANSLQTRNQNKKTEVEPITFKNELILKDIVFRYPNKSEPVLNKLNITIPVNSTIGLVGKSGSGKSTIIDIILGLIEPDQGFLKIDDKVINGKNSRNWQKNIGFVPQHIFLSEGTIAENIAFGVEKKDIDIDRVNQTLELAHLSSLIKSFENGIQSKIGERGVQLSGGQRQRVGIARALYHDADVLIFDEATSALDGITEKMIMSAIDKYKGTKTIILIAHRLKTIQRCDKILVIEKGYVTDQGSYADLISRNESFKKMSNHA